MTHELNSKLIKKLQSINDMPCISIYLPMKRGYNGAGENRIIYKNSISTVKKMINNPAIPTSAKRNSSWLKIANNIADDTLLWKNQHKSLAIFINHDRYYAVPLDTKLEKRIFVGSKFILEPLQKITHEAPDNFWILALSQKFTRLFRVEKSRISQIDEEKIPKNLKESLRFDEYEKELQTHPVALGGSKNSEGFHGHGYFKDHEKSQLEEYLRKVAIAVKKTVNKSEDIMFILGTAQISNRYRQVNKYKYLISSDIHLNVDHLKSKQIYKLILHGK